MPVVGQADSNIDMSWDTLAGELSDALLAAFEVRAAKDGVSKEKHERAAYFRSHLERGIAQLQNAKSLSDLAARTRVGEGD